MSSLSVSGFRTALLLVAVSLLAACSAPKPEAATPDPTAMRIADQAAIEDVLARANQGFEFSDANQFADAFADDAVYELPGPGPVFGYQRMRYDGRAQIREIITDRIEGARTTDPRTLTYDPATLRRYNRNSDSRIQITDATHARHWSTWMVVMKTNVNIHISAIGRYEDLLEKKDGKWLITSRKRIE
jgi:ketosteroid isomerase-like protein